MAKKKSAIPALLDRMVTAMEGGDPRITFDLESEFRKTILERPEADGEFVELLPRLVPKTPKDEPRINVALDLLSWLLDELRINIEKGRSGAGERLEGLQGLLATHVFGEGGDPQLCSAVSRSLLESRVEILPAIFEANRRRMLAFTAESNGEAPADVAPLIVEALAGIEVHDPHEAIGIIMDQTGLLDPESQIAIAGEMTASVSPLLRDTAALMLFHPRGDVRTGVAKILAGADGATITPETLRRLIIVRNWFPQEFRSDLDLAISNARRGRVECAPLKGNKVHSIFATTIDGAGAQSLWITVREQKHVELCNILWKQGAGVVDTFVHRLPSIKAAERFMEGLPDMMCFSQVGMEYVDMAMGFALAVGIEKGHPPHRGLLRIAEIIGTDRWKGEPFDPARELELIRRGEKGKTAMTDPEESLDDSYDWPGTQDFADAWFEDDDDVDRVVSAVLEKKGVEFVEEAVEEVLQKILEPRRRIWQERLILMTRWLHSSPKPPVPWQSMFHLADALFSGRPMAEIPLMRSIAEVTCAVTLERSGFGE
jgi:hypothetical protein